MDRTEISAQPPAPGSAPSTNTPSEKDAYLDEKAKVSTDALPYEQAEAQYDPNLEKFTDEDLFAGEPFAEESLPHEDHSPLTIRALLVGALLGCVICASNIYLGLKTGFTFGGGLFGGIVGFAVIKFMSRTFPAAWGGQSFGPKENVTVQSAATASSGLASMFVAAVPAMYRLNLLTTPSGDFGRLITFSVVSAFYGCFFAVPLRKFYVLKQRLVFPSATATALTIRSLHSIGGAATAMKKVKALLITFVSAMTFCVVNTYASGILMDWHIFGWLWQWGWRHALAVDNWGWYIELTPAYVGSGMLAGLNSSLSFLGGAFLAWAVIGPSLIATGQAKGRVLEEMVPTSAMSFISMSYKPATMAINEASPRYWLLWPGVLLMFGVSVAELACNGGTIYRGCRNACLAISDQVRRRPVRKFEGEIDDPSPESDQVRPIYWISGLLLSIAFTVVVCNLQFDMNPGTCILAIILAFFFSFIGCQSSGTTDVNPLSAVAKASQLILGGVAKGQGLPQEKALLENLIGGSIASSAAAHAVDMVGDMKTGHWLRASPKSQFWAQLFGSVVAIPLSVGLYVLFSKAYPCINDVALADESCPFSVPSVAAWQAVATAVIAPKLPVSLSSGLTAIFLTLLGMLNVVARYFWLPEKWKKYSPNGNAIGLSFIIPQVYIPIAMAAGATFAHFWGKKYPANAEIYTYSVAAGLVAGEGIAGVINAALTIGGVSGADVGSHVGLTSWMY